MTKIETTDAPARCEACGEPWPCEKSHKYFHKARVTTDALARAIESLGAVEVPGHPGLYAHKHATGGNYIVVSDQELLRNYGNGTTGYWNGPEMPAWWTPQQQYAWQCFTCLRVKLNREDDMAVYECTDDTHSHLGGRITCDLTTGEELEA